MCINKKNESVFQKKHSLVVKKIKRHKAANSCWFSLYPSFKDNQEERASVFLSKNDSRPRWKQ